MSLLKSVCDPKCFLIMSGVNVNIPNCINVIFAAKNDIGLNLDKYLKNPSSLYLIPWWIGLL